MSIGALGNLTEIRRNNDQPPTDNIVVPAEHRLGPYQLGSLLNTGSNPPVNSLYCRLGRLAGRSEYHAVKIVDIPEECEGEAARRDADQGSALLNTERRMLLLLSNRPGVIRQRGAFRARMEVPVRGQRIQQRADKVVDLSQGRAKPPQRKHRVLRIGLAMDCVWPHDFDDQSKFNINLKQYVIEKGRLDEGEALRIFHTILQTVHALHKDNIVHRDLKLANMILDRRHNTVTLTNFCLSRQLSRDSELLEDQLGSPAYISPDILSGRPYSGQASDMWALGVVLFSMLYGQFPFNGPETSTLFRNIQGAANFVIPSDERVSERTKKDLICNLLTRTTRARLTATRAVDNVGRILSMMYSTLPLSYDQVVPQMNHRSCTDDVAVVPQKPLRRKVGKSQNSSSMNVAKSSHHRHQHSQRQPRRRQQQQRRSGRQVDRLSSNAHSAAPASTVPVTLRDQTPTPFVPASQIASVPRGGMAPVASSEQQACSVFHYGVAIPEQLRPMSQRPTGVPLPITEPPTVRTTLTTEELRLAHFVNLL